MLFRGEWHWKCTHILIYAIIINLACIPFWVIFNVIFFQEVTFRFLSINMLHCIVTMHSYSVYIYCQRLPRLFSTEPLAETQKQCLSYEWTYPIQYRIIFFFNSKMLDVAFLRARFECSARFTAVHSTWSVVL